MDRALALETAAPPLQLVTAAELEITPAMRPWVDRYRPHALPILATALTALRHRVLPPCLLVHGPADSGKSLLATALVQTCEAIWCLDCLANAYRYRANLRLDGIVLDGCAVFVIDAIELLSGAELQRFYERCLDNGTMLVLMSPSKHTPLAIGFPLPANTPVFRLSPEDGLVPEGSPMTLAVSASSC